MIKLFHDTYEDAPTIIKLTSELWIEFSADARNGDYWGEYIEWIEPGKILESGAYEIDPLVVDVSTVNRRAEVVLNETPDGYSESGGMMARYIRNPILATSGIIETGAKYYVPEGSSPRGVHISIENHLNWLVGYLIHVGVDPVTNKLVTWVTSEDGYPFAWEPLADINFQYDRWFDLKLLYDTRVPNEFVIIYESPYERISVKSNRFVLQGPMPGFVGLPAFNFYAGASNLPGSPPQTFYVDDFYAYIDPKFEAVSKVGLMLFGAVVGGIVTYFTFRRGGRA